MKEIVIAKAVTYSAKVGGGTISGYNEVNLLLPGAVAIFTEDEVLITTATLPAAIANVKQFYILQLVTERWPLKEPSMGWFNKFTIYYKEIYNYNKEVICYQFGVRVDSE